VSRKVVVFLLLLALPLLAVSPGHRFTDDGWEIIVDGVEYREFRVSGPNRVYVARLDRNNPYVTIDSAIAQGDTQSRLETVSSMAERYEQTINAWGGTWGTRSDVVIAINGSYHDTETGEPEGTQIHSSWFTHWQAGWLGPVGFVWTMDRQAAIATCMSIDPERQILTYLASGATQPIHGVDIPFVRHGLILYTPETQPQSPGGEDRVEVLVQLTQPVRVTPPPHMVTGVIQEIHQGEGPIPIPFDHVVLSGVGRSASQLLEQARIGDPVGISLEITDYLADCDTPRHLDLTNGYAGIGGGFIFLRGGEIFEQDDPGARTRHPRTAIGFNEDYVYFVVVDGRDDDWSVGMTLNELAAFCRDTLGASWALNQDGGGSSTMWVNGVVRNRPSDGHERAVANGMMFVTILPMARSTAFIPGDSITTAGDAELRLGPGWNYAAIANTASGSSGRILADANRLNGVLAGGAHWWQVALPEASGWIPEEALSLVPEDSPPRVPQILP
jgi:hypothetical protein